MSAAQYLELYQSLTEVLPGQNMPWLSEIRQQAREKFAGGGFPTPREEEWKYTNVTALEKKLFKTSAEPGEEAVGPWLDDFYLADAWTVVLMDGFFSPGLSRLDGLPGNVIACGMTDALKHHPGRVKTLLGSALGLEAHGFIAFNTAFFSDGAFVEIPTGVSLSRPLQILHVSTRPEGLANTRSLVGLAANAGVRLVETYAGAQQAYLTAAVTEIKLAENAGLDHYKWQVESDQAHHFGGIYVSQERSSRFNQHNFCLGGLLARTEIHTELADGAECDMNGLFLGLGRQHVDNHTRIHHREPNGISRETYRGILADRARGVFQGRIVVHPNAQKTNAEMNSHNLLLSDDAEIDAKPQLEILADDVKCSHGLAVGQLDEESVFFLQSRGVGHETARNMLTFAFAQAMVEKIGLESLRFLVQERLLNRFPQSGIRRDWL
ncbi:MAG: Fe-S cluster assembly protein SufD [Methylococcaceae bacterium]|nr:Fe-S cluster assembly protein SufD [Methylococcaceae bacterium]